MSSVDWTQLPEELLESITKILSVYSDYIRFRCVCRSWLSSAAKIPTHLPPQLPWLLLPSSLQRRGHTCTTAFLDLSDGGNKLRLLHLPEASRAGTRCCGSSHGWLAVLDDSPAILLLNPLTRLKLHLPPLSSFPNVIQFSYSHVGCEFSFRSSSTGEPYSLSLRHVRDSYVKKIILSSSPLGSDDFFALALINHGCELVFTKRGDQSWRFIDDARSFNEDAVFSDGLFYAVNKQGSIAVCDVSRVEPAVSIIATPMLVGKADMHYLVSSVSGLLLVSRFLDVDRDNIEEKYRTVKFEVFRMVWGGPRWEKVEDLGDLMLFIGQNSSVSFSARDFPGCIGNCIYFTDDYSELNYVYGGCDCGIFRLCDGRVEGQWNSRSVDDHWPAPIWVSPNPF